MEETLIIALKSIVLAYDQGRNRMAEIAMDALDEVTGAPSIVRQSKSFTKALEGLDGQESVGLLD